MENLDINVAIDIAMRVGADSFINLGGMLGTSKFYNTLASDPAVLRTISLQYLFNNPHLITNESPFHPFFSRCVQAGNPTACYLESLKLATREGRAEYALQMLLSQPDPLPHANFTIALLQVCLGFYDDALRSCSTFLCSAGSFEAADSIGSTVFSQIMQIGPLKIRSHSNTWKWVDIPLCLGCNLSNRCSNCFLYWFSVMYLLLC
ncbi:unnamed protein product [Arabidopsis arenosa]|uniref:Uncharacterized protein n=1 Tax=Arabidopsis arenosa TaxID=38785 RepID=A0A8S2B649_ARAAE|nr:unnamed protein product [Arabidopsis arenosa]